MKIWLSLIAVAFIFLLLQLMTSKQINITSYDLIFNFIKAVISYCVVFAVFSQIFQKNILKILQGVSSRNELADIIKSNENLANYEKQIITETITNQFFKEKIYTFLKDNKIMEFKE